jgi:RHS repeat-associated protein
VANNFGTESVYTTLSEYRYGDDEEQSGYDELGRRTYAQRTGPAFAASNYETYDYDGRSELTAAHYFTGTYDSGTPNTSKDRAYEYDTLGNRTSSSNAPGTDVSYVVSALNQYDGTSRLAAPIVAQGLLYDVDGNLWRQWKAGDMNCDGRIDPNDANAFTLAMNDCGQYAQQYPSCNCMNADINADGVLDSADVDAMSELIAGTGVNSSVTLTYTWDGENRLVKVEPTPGTQIPSTAKRVTFKYDYLGRRVWKQVETRIGSTWTIASTTKYVYDGWRVVLELNGLNSVQRKYTWGLDLAGLNGNPGCNHSSAAFLEGAGGIGGLLAVYDPSGARSYIYFYDAAGNVGQVVNWSYSGTTPADSIVAKYEYDAYGNITAKSGSYADTNPFRFSTKYFDAETGLSDYGHRYYNPGMGRWLNRDPIGELGGANLYGYVGNDPVNRFDPLGLAAGGGCPKEGDPPQSQPQTQPTTPADCAERYGPAPSGYDWSVSGNGCQLKPSYSFENPPGACTTQPPNGEMGWIECKDGKPIRCKGSDVNNLPPEQQYCLMEAHEKTHIAENPGVCEGKKDGTVPILDDKSSKQTECSAFKKERECVAKVNCEQFRGVNPKTGELTVGGKAWRDCNEKKATRLGYLDRLIRKQECP